MVWRESFRGLAPASGAQRYACCHQSAASSPPETTGLTTNTYRLYQLFKYAVYALLAFNIAWFFSIEWPASEHRFGNGLRIADIIDAFASTIDTTAWVVLLLMFELETYVLDERHFTKRVIVSLHVLRAICYGFIVYSFFGYVFRLTFVQSAVPLANVDTVCALVAGQWTYMATLDNYVSVTATSCSALGQSGPLFNFPGLQTVVGQADLAEAVRLAWVDVINAGVWLGVVLLLETRRSAAGAQSPARHSPQNLYGDQGAVLLDPLLRGRLLGLSKVRLSNSGMHSCGSSRSFS